MDMLDRDCLSNIFLNLDFTERVKLENVCHLWYHVLQQQSTYADCKSLDISKFLTNTTTEYYQQESISFSPTVIGVLERCGRYVIQLTFGQRWLKISQPIVDCIASNCIAIRVLDLGAVILSADLSPLLEKIASRLEVLSFEDTSWVNIQHAQKIQNFFASMINLQSLNLRAVMFELDRLNELPPTLRFVELSCARSFAPEVFLSFLRSQTELVELGVSPIPAVNDEIIVAIGQLTNIHTLRIGHSYQVDVSYDSLMHLAKMHTLKFEAISSLTDITLEHILPSMPQLKQLSIRKCNSIRQYTPLGHCSKLVTLEIIDAMNLSDEDLFTICAHRQLRSIALINCFNLTNRGMSTALTRCQFKDTKVYESVQIVVNRCAGVSDETMYMLASTQTELETISLQNCTSITSKGACALGWLRNVHLLREVDVSHNRHVDDTVVTSLHNALTMVDRQEHNTDGSSQCHKQTKNKQRMIMYIFDTSINPAINEDVKDLILLC